MNNKVIKEKNAFLTLLIVIMTLGSFAQSKNEYAFNPLTPGYGVSEYFELMPNKVRVAPVNKEKVVSRQSFSALIVCGRMLVLQFIELRPGNRFSFTVYSLNGRRILSKEDVSVSSGNSIMSLTLPKHFPDGIYLLTVSQGGVNKFTYRFIKTKLYY